MEATFSKEEKVLIFALTEMTTKIVADMHGEMVETRTVLELKMDDSFEKIDESLKKMEKSIDESFERITKRQGDSLEKIIQGLDRLDTLLASNHSETMSQLGGIEASMRFNNKQ